MTVSRDALVEAFRQRGFQLWVVGGALRDELLGTGGGDEDFATNALPDDVEDIARSRGADVITVGKKFGTIGVHAGGRWSEITTFRGDSYEAGSRWPDVTFGTTIEEDLARRDFTINAFARDVYTDRLLDLFGGKDDLDARIIRAVGEPAQRFREDPLRILRGIRFASQLGFSIDDATLEGMRETAELTATLSAERIGAEFDRLICGVHPRIGLEYLRDSGVLPVLFPELHAMVGCEQNRFHKFDVWGHTVATIEAIHTQRENYRLRRWAALAHDVGKPPVRHIKKNGEWGFYSHEKAGVDVAREMLHRLKVGRHLAYEICLLVQRHMDRPAANDRRSVRRFMARCEGHWRDLLALKRADNASHTYDDTEYHDALEAMCERIEADEAERLRAESPLDGNELAALFERTPGPWIGRIKRELSNRVLDGKLAPGDKEAAAAIARKLMGEAPSVNSGRRRRSG